MQKQTSALAFTIFVQSGFSLNRHQWFLVVFLEMEVIREERGPCDKYWNLQAELGMKYIGIGRISELWIPVPLLAMDEQRKII